MVKPEKIPAGIYIRLPKDLYVALRDEAQFENRSMAGQVRHVLTQDLRMDL